MKSPRSLISSPTMASPQGTSFDAAYRQSRSPFRFLASRADEYDEKDGADGAELSAMASATATARSPTTSSSSHSHSRSQSQSHSHSQPHSRSQSRSRPTSSSSSRRSRPSTPIAPPPQQQHIYGYPSRAAGSAAATPLPAPCTLSSTSPPLLCARLCDRARPWIPLGLWVATSLGFLLAIAFWRSEVFQRLDEFSHWLQAQGWYGYAVLFVLIFITTVPPFPLYSTFMTLSGYCFGALPGAVISYVASLSGAVAVFLLSRAYCSAYIGTLFQRSPSLKRVVRAIERRPNILFLIRLAPYPYNVMNVLLAASPVLTLRTFTACTALSLLKVIIHTSIGASIHSFSHHAQEGEDAGEDGSENGLVSKVSTAVGIALCIGVFVYITAVARRAVDGELEEDAAGDSEEAVAFLHDDDPDGDGGGGQMRETGASRMTTAR